MTNLLDKALEMQNLRLAWNEVEENKGMGGVDGVSLKAWRRNWEERLANLAAAVRANTYKPLKLRLRRIPKQDARQFRTLRIPAISDRVLQRAVLEVLYPVFEPRFLDCSYGYRPGRGLRVFVREFSDRLEATVTPREIGRPLSYRKLFEVQARHVANFILGKEAAYRPFRAR